MRLLETYVDDDRTPKITKIGQSVLITPYLYPFAAQESATLLETESRPMISYCPTQPMIRKTIHGLVNAPDTAKLHVN